MRASLSVGALLFAGAATACRPRPVTRDLVVAQPLHCVVDHRHGAPLVVGTFFGDTIDTPQKVNAAMALFEQQLGVPPRIVRFYANLSTPLGAAQPGRGTTLQRAKREGASPMIVLEPTWRHGPSHHLLDRILAGDADSLIAQRIREIASLELGDVYIELAPEMNARFGAPWQPEEESLRSPEKFVAAWRHIVSVARTQRTNGLRWIWAPSAGNAYTHAATGDTHWNFADHYYPGDDVVDFVGLHAFNDPVAQRAWIPFVELVNGDAADRALSELVRRHPSKPVMITEIASDEHPDRIGAKGVWITDMFRALSECRSVVGVVWFDMRKERAWQVGSSSSSIAAFRAALRTP